jgi:hypothetical protein
MKWIAGIVAVLLLAACGGGGGGSGGGGGTDTGGGSEAQDLLALYQGVKDDVVLNESNQVDYLKMLYSVDDSAPQSVSAASRIRARLPVVHSAMALRRDSRSQINEILDCVSGSGTVTGEMNDNIGVGKLTYQFNDCYQNGLYISGKQIIDYQRWDLNNYIPLDYTITNEALRYSLNSYYQELNGEIQVKDQGLCTEVTTENMLSSSSNKSDEVYVANLVTKNTCGKLDITGAIYLAQTGRVSISTLNNYNLGEVYSNETYKNYSLPVSGTIRLTGKKSSLTITSRIEKPDYSYWDQNRTTISLDQDGDGKADHSYDMPTWYLGVSLLVNYSDSDHDGMWDGWESFYGTNPKIDDGDLDSDSDGLSNYLEFIVGTSIKNSSENLVALYSTLHLSVEKPDLIYQNVSFVMSISVSGTVSPWLKKYKVHDDLMLDMSNLGDIEVTPSAGLPCIYNKDHKSLICKDIDLSQFASDTAQTLNLGNITIIPHTASWSSYLTASWSGHLQITSETIDLDISASDATYTMPSETKAWGIEAIGESLVFPVNLHQNGNGIPSKISIHGEWTNPDLKVNRFEPIGYGSWNCNYSVNSFSCDAIPDTVFALQGGVLYFDKPNEVGTHTIDFTVTTYYGGTTRISTNKSLIVVGHDTDVINQGILTAVQQGQLEYVIPDGIYVGAVQGSYADGFTIKGSANSQLWLYEPSSGNYLSASSYSIYADILDGLTINAPATVYIYAVSGVKHCNISISTGAQYNNGAIESPLVDGNKISFGGYVSRLFIVRSDQKIQNNLIINKETNESFLMDGERLSNWHIQMHNNTLVGTGLMYSVWNAGVNVDLKNNLFIAAHGSEDILPFNSSDSGQKSFTNNIFPVGYSAIGGNNLFIDNPGVDINHDYLLQADSPARDAGVAVDGLGDTDWQGLPRVVGAAPDIGASEYQTAP